MSEWTFALLAYIVLPVAVLFGGTGLVMRYGGLAWAAIYFAFAVAVMSRWIG